MTGEPRLLTPALVLSTPAGSPTSAGARQQPRANPANAGTALQTRLLSVQASKRRCTVTTRAGGQSTFLGVKCKLQITGVRICPPPPIPGHPTSQLGFRGPQRKTLVHQRVIEAEPSPLNRPQRSCF